MFFGGAQPTIWVSLCRAQVGSEATAADNEKQVTPVGFEPTPLRNGALSHRLRPLGQSVDELDFRRPYQYPLSCSAVSPHLASKPAIIFCGFS